MLAKFLNILIESDIEIRALTVAENKEFGLLLFLVDKSDECIKLLEKNNYDVSITEVIAVKMILSNNTKELREIAKILGENEVNIEYLYSALIKNESYLILRLDNNKKGKEVLKTKGYDVVSRT
jgi:hypothetical protein